MYRYRYIDTCIDIGIDIDICIDIGTYIDTCIDIGIDIDTCTDIGIDIDTCTDIGICRYTHGLLRWLSSKRIHLPMQEEMLEMLV